MNHTAFRERETGERSGYDAELIRSHLKRVLESSAFRGSKRSSTFLEFVVEGALTNRWDDLKERSLAVAIFDRPPDVDLAEDTIVRVGAREVRKRLAQYYVSKDGANDNVRIDLAAGTYVPQFHVSTPPLPPAEVSEPAVASPKHFSPRHFRVLPAIAAILALTAVVVAVWTLSRKNVDQVEELWQPIIGSSATVLIGAAHPVVYQPSLKSWQKETELFRDGTETLQSPFEFPEKDLSGNKMQRIREQFVGYSDMVCVMQVTRFLTTYKKMVRLRMATHIDVSDLRENPVVLVGAFTNRWTSDLTSKMRFHFQWGAEMSPQIQDREQNRVWEVPPGLSDPSHPEDYFLITRAVNGPAGRPFLILAGLKQAGTEAAGYLATTPAELTRVLKALPAGWQSKNLQLVLHTRVVGGEPSEFELVAYHVW
jgi:hypothetical protein